MATTAEEQTDETRSRAARPADECPWRRPFPEGFNSCPAFQQTHFIPLDTEYRPLTPVLTCRHLITQPLPGGMARWYGACDVGDAQSRQNWVADVDSNWLDGVARIRREMEILNRPFIQKIWAVKARELKALHDGQSSDQATRELNEVADQFLGACKAFVDEHANEFQALDLPPDAVLALLSRSLTDFVNLKTADARWMVPDELLRRFPRTVRIFFRPRDRK